MPFIALIKETGERVDITQDPSITLRFAPGMLVCQLCGHPMVPRSEHTREGYKVRAHFRHMAKICDSIYQSHPESREHREGKRYVATEWLPQFGRYKGAVIDYEVRIEEVRRVADVLATLTNGQKIAHEIQLAGITPRELQERSDDYAAAGIDVYWHIGKAADTEPNRQFLGDTFGDYSRIFIVVRDESDSSPVASNRNNRAA